MQGAQFDARVGAEPVGEHGAHLVVRGQRLSRTPGVAQGAQPERLERFVDGVLAAELGQLRQHPFGPAEGERGSDAGAAGVEPPGRPADRDGVAVREVGEHRSAPQVQRVVEDAHGLRRIALLQGPRPLPREPLEPVQVDGVRFGGQPVAVLRRGDRRMAERPPEPSHECLQGARRVRGRVPVPHLVDEHGGRHRPAGPQRENGEQGAQPRPADGDGRAVVAECLGGTEDAVAHAPILRDRSRERDRRPAVCGRTVRRTACHAPTLHGTTGRMPDVLAVSPVRSGLAARPLPFLPQPPGACR